jgi:hypothetical protein
MEAPTNVFCANIVVTILTFALIIFGVHNLFSFYRGLAEYKSTIGFYIFSLTTLISNCANSWINVSGWYELPWQITSLITHYTTVCMALCQGICFVIIILQLIALKQEQKTHLHF